MPLLDHLVLVSGKKFSRTYDLPHPPQNGLRVSLGAEASFIVEDLTFHHDANRYSCKTVIETSNDSPLDDVLSYYDELGYRVDGKLTKK